MQALPLADPGFARALAELVTRLGRKLSRAADELRTAMVQRMTAFR